MKKCIIEKCNNKYYGKGLCKKHHQKQWCTPEYASWISMKQRCYNKNNKSYIYYGGIGITVCQDWLNSYDSFYNFIGPKPTPLHSVDRINSNGNYEPGNVRWANKHQQAFNRRKSVSNKSGFIGVYWSKSKNKWVAEINRKHIGVFNSKDEAIKARERAEILEI